MSTLGEYLKQLYNFLPTSRPGGPVPHHPDPGPDDAAGVLDVRRGGGRGPRVPLLAALPRGGGAGLHPAVRALGLLSSLQPPHVW